MVHYAVKQGCVRLRNALKCTAEAIFTVMKNIIADWKAVETIVNELVAHSLDIYVNVYNVIRAAIL